MSAGPDLRCETALLVIARAADAMRAAMQVMHTTPLDVADDEPYMLAMRTALAVCNEIVELEGAPEISRAITLRLFLERDLIASMPPLRVAL